MSTSRTRWVIHKQGPLLGLIGLMVVVFVFQQALGPNALGTRWFDPLMTVPSKVLAACVALRNGTAGGTESRDLFTLLSCAFLHADISHLVYNMLALWLFAALAADLLGNRWMLLLFVTTALGGSLCHVLLNADSMVPCLGASGAVMGFEGAYLGLATRFRLPEPQVWPMARPIPPSHLALLALFGVSMDYFGLMGGGGARIAFGAHIGGFTTGLFLTALLAPRPQAARAG
ncbi:MAG: rhomboid family intramembrane serine protease [Akkermansiaceae bacterium]|nr:rhomboid family intramembrane serine protease [Akkermansiaceae bacterium]